MRFKLNSVSTTAEGIILDVTALDALPPDDGTGPDPDDGGTGHEVTDELLGAKQREVLKRLFAEGHPWAVQCRTMADYAEHAGKPADGDFGQWATIVYLATGDEAYARKALERNKATFLSAPNNRDYSREYFAIFALHYKWLRPAMSDAEAREYRDRLYSWAEHCLRPVGAGWGTRIGDVDEVFGHEAGLRLTAIVTAKEDPERSAALLANPQLAEMRAEIRRVCKIIANGGQGASSSEYNLGEHQLLLIGAYADDIAKFPEVAAVAKALCDQTRWMTRLDHVHADWGDVQQPRSQHLSEKVGLLSLLAGLTGDPRPRSLLAELTKDKPIYPNYWFHLYRGLWCFDPTLPAEPYVAPVGMHVGGFGHIIHRGPRHFAQIYAPTWNGVDHEQSLFPDYRLWLDGEEVIGHPLGYDTRAWTNNTSLMAGHSRMSVMEVVSIEETPTGCIVITRQGGKLPDSWATFVEDWTRKTEFIAPNKFVITDSFKGQRPKPEELSYPALIEASAKAPALWQVIQHTPVEPTKTPTGYTWKTKGGKTVTLTGSDRSIVMKTTHIDGNFNPGELDGWQVRFLSDAPTAEIRTTVEVGQ